MYGVIIMDIFQSQWLIKMLTKSCETPKGKVLNLFGILENWISAPNIQFSIDIKAPINQSLIDFFTKQAQFLGANNPDMLAIQIIVIARQATLEAIASKDCSSLTHAKKVVEALLFAYTRQNILPNKISRHARYGVAASTVLLLGTLILIPITLNNEVSQLAQLKSKQSDHFITTHYTGNKMLSPKAVADILTKYERLRVGSCHYPEVLSIPRKHRKIYMEKVVGGQLPENESELAITNLYLEKLNCYFPSKLNSFSIT